MKDMDEQQLDLQDSKTEKKIPEFTKEQIQLMQRGIRPPEVSYLLYKAMCRIIDAIERKHKQGQLIHISSFHGMRKGKGSTYVDKDKKK
jgi:hypothetical protein